MCILERKKKETNKNKCDDLWFNYIFVGFLLIGIEVVVIVVILLLFFAQL